MDRVREISTYGILLSVRRMSIVSTVCGNMAAILVEGSVLILQVTGTIANCT